MHWAHGGGCARRGQGRGGGWHTCLGPCLACRGHLQLAVDMAGACCTLRPRNVACKGQVGCSMARPITCRPVSPAWHRGPALLLVMLTRMAACGDAGALRVPSPSGESGAVPTARSACGRGGEGTGWLLPRGPRALAEALPRLCRWASALRRLFDVPTASEELLLQFLWFGEGTVHQDLGLTHQTQKQAGQIPLVCALACNNG